MFGSLVVVLTGRIGCIDSIEPHLVTLVPYLINMLNDSKVSRFESWFYAVTDAAL